MKVDVVEDRLHIDLTLTRLRNAVRSIRERKLRTFDRTAERKNCKAIRHKRGFALLQVNVDDCKAPAQCSQLPTLLSIARQATFDGLRACISSSRGWPSTTVTVRSATWTAQQLDFSWIENAGPSMIELPAA